MKKAGIEHKSLVIDILCESFADNQSVNYITKKSSKKRAIRNLMAYSFDICLIYGEVYLSDDHKGCALVLYPDQKKVTIKTILLDIQLVLGALGLRNLIKIINREKAIKSNYPEIPFYYLWFIGVFKGHQHTGVGSKLLLEITEEAKQQQKPIYLETSTKINLSWYENFGFSIYKKLEFGYTLFLLNKVS